MKRWNNKVRVVWILAAAVAGVGCVFTKADPPTAPAVESEAQMAAVSECEIISCCWNRACSDRRDAYNRPRPQNRQCFASCQSGLENCYKSCE